MGRKENWEDLNLKICMHLTLMIHSFGARLIKHTCPLMENDTIYPKEKLEKGHWSLQMNPAMITNLYVPCTVSIFSFSFL